jgi:methylated-DNA-[protein]-cysteine S-methyltransferase
MKNINPTTEKAIKSGRTTAAMNFDQKVWAMTVRIPPGKVTTYGAIARRLGTQAYRAVGMALNRNPYAPAVPCHRVVGSNGKLTGYAGGLPRKKKMLTAEGVSMKGDRVDLSSHFVKP